MNIIQLINVFKRHILLLVTVPVLLAVIVTYLTRNPTLEYESETIIYTGIASGYNLEQNDRFDLFGSRNAFDNLINVIKSRETLSETAIRLFALCLSLDTYDKTIISKNSFIDLRKNTPQYIKDMVIKPVFTGDSISNARAYEQTVSIFTDYHNASDTNYIYNLLNYRHKFFSIRAISGIRVNRVQSSDLVEIKYKTEDPGLTLQTLKTLTGVFIRNYKSLKENQSDAVVAYFQSQVDRAQENLKIAEDNLLKFNKGNKIINYYEQSKFIAGKKEDIEEAIQLEKMKMAGAEQALVKLEGQLQVQGQIQGVSDEILEKRNRLVAITEKLTINEIYNGPDTSSKNEIDRLKIEANLLELELNRDLNKLYSFNNSTDGLPMDDLLEQWLSYLIKFAEAKAGLTVLYNRQEDFKKNYDLFAPLGANMSRIEREIDVAEREYLSLLHSLNQAKLTQQNEQLTTNIKPLDPPYYPVNAIPSKRKILILAAAMFGFIMVAFSILLTEYFDNTIKNAKRAEKLSGLKSIGMMPKIISKYRSYDMQFITNRLTELLLQEIKYYSDSATDDEQIRTQSKLVTIFSNTRQEGKTFITGKMVDKLRAMGDRVLYMNYRYAGEQADEDDVKETTGEEKKTAKFNPLRFFNSRSRSGNLFKAIENSDNLTYTIDDTFPEKKDLFDLLPGHDIHSFDNFKYVFLEIPAVLHQFYPSAIIGQSDMNILVTRSNREWKNADSTAIDMFSQFARSKPVIFLNGCEIEEIEGVLGVLPKKRSKLRKMIKQLVRLQFYTKSSIR
jgi:polysaccharide biosynthesis transport protein